MIYKPSITHQTETERKQWERLISLTRKFGPENVLNILQSDGTECSSDAERLAEDIKEVLLPYLDKYLDEFSVTSLGLSAWQQKEGGDFLISAKPKFIRNEMVMLQRFLERIEDGWQQIKPYDPVSCSEPQMDHITWVNMFDMHLDKMTVYEETGRDTDIYKNIDLVWEKFNTLIQKMPVPQQIVFPVGNDLFNVNGHHNTTVKGTPQSAYINHKDAYSLVYDLIEQCIRKLIEIAPTTVVSVPGNHDRDLSDILNISLSKHFRNIDHVEFLASRRSRKHIVFGNNLFVTEHGDKVKTQRYTGQVAVEFPHEFAQCEYRYGIFGHNHRHMVMSEQGFEIIYLGAVSDACVWHYDNGYFGVPKSIYAMQFSYDGSYRNDIRLNF